MRVLIVHNAYQQRGGEDSVVHNEVSMLRAHGHDVLEHIVSNDCIEGFQSKVRVALGSLYSISSYRAIRRLISRFRPDVVHVHNFFPLISPSVFYACSESGVPSVLTLHNFRLLCPTALLMYGGVITERSLSEGPWWAVRKRVYRNSLMGTFALAAMISVHRLVGTWSHRVTRFVALTRFAASKFGEAGLPLSRIAVKSNFVDVAESPVAPRSGLLFVGRLSHEKGVGVLAAAVSLLDRDGCSVRVAGVGPLAKELSNTPGITSLGPLDSTAVYREMATAQALVMPSLWYEGFPMVLVEAYASGLPVIASRLGALAELVEDGVTGLLFDPGSGMDLAEKMRWASDHPEQMAQMGLQARARYEERYTEKINYEQLIAIYGDAIESAMAKK